MVYSINKTDHHHITEILLNVALNTINQIILNNNNVENNRVYVILFYRRTNINSTTSVSYDAICPVSTATTSSLSNSVITSSHSTATSFLSTDNILVPKSSNISTDLSNKRRARSYSHAGSAF